MTFQLKTPRVRVYVETPTADEFLEIDVQTDNRDAVQWDFTRARNRWPEAKEAPLLWMTFLAWNAIRRTGGPAGSGFEAFNETVVAVEPIDRDGNPLTGDAEGVADVDPTRLDPSPG